MPKNSGGDLNPWEKQFRRMYLELSVTNEDFRNRVHAASSGDGTIAATVVGKKDLKIFYDREIAEKKKRKLKKPPAWVVVLGVILSVGIMCSSVIAAHLNNPLLFIILFMSGLAGIWLVGSFENKRPRPVKPGAVFVWYNRRLYFKIIHDIHDNLLDLYRLVESDSEEYALSGYHTTDWNYQDGYIGKLAESVEDADLIRIELVEEYRKYPRPDCDWLGFKFGFSPIGRVISLTPIQGGYEVACVTPSYEHSTPGASSQIKVTMSGNTKITVKESYTDYDELIALLNDLAVS